VAAGLTPLAPPPAPEAVVVFETDKLHPAIKTTSTPALARTLPKTLEYEPQSLLLRDYRLID